METIYFATTNKGKLRQAKRILGNEFKIDGIKIKTQETGITCEANAHQKLMAAKGKFENCTIIADDYSLEIEEVTLGDVCRIEVIEALTQDIDINIKQAMGLPFPGVFANRILKYFREEELFKLILTLRRSAQAKIALAIYQTRTRATTVISESCGLSLQEEMTGHGWFWNRSYKDRHGVSCTSGVWLTTSGPRAHVLRSLKKILS